MPADPSTDAVKVEAMRDNAVNVATALMKEILRDNNCHRADKGEIPTAQVEILADMGAAQFQQRLLRALPIETKSPAESSGDAEANNSNRP